MLGDGSAPPQALERVTTEYVLAEQQLQRLPADADAAALALAVVGVVHHVALTDGTAPAAADRIRRTVHALTDIRSGAAS